MAVWPDSPDMSWNSGTCCGSALAEDRDDVGFIVALIEGLVADGLVDPARVYLSGFSNGCSLAQRIAVEHSALIAAVACFSDYLEVEPPEGLVGVPILQIHGTSDHLVPYDAAPGFAGALENAAIWARLNQCASTPEVVENDRLVTYRYADCASDAEVVQMTVIEGAHGRFFGVLPVGTIWDFLNRH